MNSQSIEKFFYCSRSENSLGNLCKKKTSTGTKGKEAIVAIEFYGQPWRVLAVRDRSGASLALEHH